MYSIEEDITEDSLYNYLTEKQIMEHYLGIPVVFNKLVRNPLRYDKKPTAGFYIANNGRLTFRDFGNCFHGNCISVVMKKLSLNYYYAVQRIYDELVKHKEIPIIPEEDKVKYERKKKILQVKRRELDIDDLSYWNQFGISKEILEQYKVTGLQTLWSDGKIIYSATRYDTAYLYDFGDDIYKSYHPGRNNYRFFTNASTFVIQGYNQLPKKGTLLIITKALKDVMTLRALGYDAVAPQAESVLISPNQMAELKARFKKVVSLMDFDYAGILMMNKLKKKYNIPAYTLTNGRFYTVDYKAKDISDYVKFHGLERTKALISER